MYSNTSSLGFGEVTSSLVYVMLYEKLKRNESVDSSQITRDFVVWLFNQYGAGDPVFLKARDMLEQRLMMEDPIGFAAEKLRLSERVAAAMAAFRATRAEATVTPTIEDVLPPTVLPGPRPVPMPTPQVANGFAPPPEAPPTFIDTAFAQTSPLLKYGLLALGAFIFYDSFMRTKPRRRTMRRRTAHRRPVRRKRRSRR